MKSARDKRKSGDLDGALADFKAAHALVNVTTTGLEVGKTQLEMGRLVEARDTLLAVARLPKERWEPNPIKRARDEASKLAEEISPRIPSAKLEIRGAADLSKVTVSVDGVKLVKESLGVALKLNPGDHEATVRVGETEKRATFHLDEGEEKTVSIEAPKPPPPPPPPTKVPPILVPIGFATAGVALLGGIVTGSIAVAQHGSIADKCDGTRCPPETWGDIDTARGLGTTSTVTFAIAGAFAAASVVGLILLPKAEEPAPKAAIVPWVGPGTAGAVVGVRY